MDDVLIVGGGVVGLSIAYELAARDLRVHLIDRGAPGGEASWAGAGILPPTHTATARHPIEKLAALSCALHPHWHDTLREETGIDNGYRRCGGLYLSATEDEAALADAALGAWQQEQVAVERLSRGDLAAFEPALSSDDLAEPAALYLPGEAQIRNPWHLKALIAACTARGVRMTAGLAAEDFEQRGECVTGVVTTTGTLRAGRVCITTGAWTRGLLARLETHVAIRPIRGQMLLLSTPRPLLSRIVNHGPRYIVPRPDGCTLVGSTEEDVGFDKRTTGEGVAGLLQFALGRVKGLADAKFERSWAGLRPATVDRLPILGRVAGRENVFVAAGHFRSGLLLSPGTARVMGQLLVGETPEIDLAPLGPQRDGAVSGQPRV